MTVLEIVNRYVGKVIRLHCCSSGYTEFISANTTANALLCGRKKNILVDHIETQNGIVNIYT